MEILSVSLKGFRNLKSTSITLSPHTNIFYGDNGQGKTNFLESVYFCATGRSHRTHVDKELINHSIDESYIQLMFQNDDIKDKISVHLKRDQKKGIAINSEPVKKIGDLLGNLIIVMFSPEDLNLVKEGPAGRRKFMDMEICQISKIYYHELNNYHRVLKQRNNLLKFAAKNKSALETISVWDEQLINHGIKIYDIRKNFAYDLNEIASEIYQKITDGREILSLQYRPNITPQNFHDKLKRNLERDIITGNTYTGIHKDDIYITLNNNDIRLYASQGQQRTAALSMKLAEIEMFKKTKNKKPVLLLDDVLSELDAKRQKYLLYYINSVQTILTCTAVKEIKELKEIQLKPTVFQVVDGEIF